MARTDYTSDWYGLAKKRLGPGWKRMRKMDRDDWLASIGLERRNVAADVAGAVGFALFGAAIGFGLGMLFAPSRGTETRQQLARKVREYRGGEEHAGREASMPPTWQS